VAASPPPPLLLLLPLLLPASRRVRKCAAGKMKWWQTFANAFF